MEAQSTVQIPRVAIRFCTQCKWNLRAAYYAQELLQTFSTSLGEIALIPCTGGVFTITLYHHDTVASTTTTTTSDDATTTDDNDDKAEKKITTTQIWDRKTDGGFPNTKELKNRVRNIIEPERDMGHIDRSLKKGVKIEDGGEERKKADEEGKSKEERVVVSDTTTEKKEEEVGSVGEAKEKCEDCRCG